MGFFEIQKEQEEQLDENGSITYTDLVEILDAFQIASGQTYAIGKTKALILYLKKKNVLKIENFKHSGKDRNVTSIEELADIFKSMDEYIDLRTHKDFKEYF
jgi:hypothetical protein